MIPSDRRTHGCLLLSRGYVNKWTILRQLRRMSAYVLQDKRVLNCFDDVRYQNLAMSRSFVKWFRLIRDSCLEPFVNICVAFVLPECLEAFGGKNWSRPTMVQIMHHSVDMQTTQDATSKQLNSKDPGTSVLRAGT